MAGALEARNSFPLRSPPPRRSVSKKKKKFFFWSLAPAPRPLHGVWVQTLAEFRGVQAAKLPTSARVKGVQQAERRAPGYFYLLPPRLRAPPSQQLHMPARLKASMKTAVEALSSCEQKEKKKQKRVAHRGGGWGRPSGGSLEESESGGSVLSNFPEKGKNSDVFTCARWRHSGSVTITWFFSRNWLFLE